MDTNQNNGLHKSKIKTTIGAQISLEQKEQLQEEAKNLGMTLSKYLVYLINKSKEIEINNVVSQPEIVSLSDDDLNRFNDTLYTSLNKQFDKFEHRLKNDDLALFIDKILSLQEIFEPEEVIEAKNFLKTDFTYEELMEFLEAKDYVDYTYYYEYQGKLSSLLPFSLSEESKEILIHFIDWMIENNLAANAESVLMGNAIAYLKTGLSSWSKNAEQTDLFLAPFEELAEKLNNKNEEGHNAA